MFQDFGQDLRYGLRSLRRSPGFAVTVVLTLALGIGANTAIFSLIDFVFLRPLPVTEPGGLVLFSDKFNAGFSGGKLHAGPLGLLPYPLFARLRQEARSFGALAAQQSGRSVVALRRATASADASVELGTGQAVSANYFDVVGVRAHRGRTFVPEDDTHPGGNRVVVLSHDFWQRRFGGDEAVLGARVDIRAHSYTVVGVAAPRFVGTRVGVEVIDFWVPMSVHAELMDEAPLFANQERRWLVVAGRRAAGASMTAAEAEANVILQRFLAENPALAVDDRARAAIRIDLVSGARGISPLRQEKIRLVLFVAMAGVGLLLLIVCLNLSHLLIARTITRQREISVRAALGASRGRLARQLLAEGLLLSAAGSAAALIGASWMVDGLLALIPPGLPLTLDVRVDGRVLGFAALIALGTTVLLGLLPAWHATRLDLRHGLQGATAAIVGGSQRRISRWLLGSQVALSLVLMVAAGLLARTLANVRDVDKGFEVDRVLIAELRAGLLDLDHEQQLGLYDDLLRRVRALPGVETASLSRFALLGGGHARGGVVVEGRALRVEAEIATVTPDHFATLGIPLLRGRSLARDDDRGAPPVVVINETFARHFAGADPLGARIRFADAPGRGAHAIIGVVRDVKNDGLRDPTKAMVYRAVAQAPTGLGSLEVRTAVDPARLLEPVRRAVRAAHAELPLAGIRTMQSQVDRALAGERALAVLATAFGLAALLLVGVGLYGVIAQWATLRRREIGVRMSLGATSAGVRWMVVRQAFTFVLAGILAGLVGAAAVSHLLRRFLFGLHPLEPATWVAATVIMLAVAATAAYLPARRAARVDPMAALRQD